MKTSWARESELERNADNFGREFFEGGLNPWRNKADKFTEEFRCENSLRISPAIGT